MSKYEHKKIEAKWKNTWEKSGIYQTTESASKPKFYVLDMFPYPSGAGLHVGHPKGYIATDVIARMKMMQGFNVLHPMGWDAFGLPAENYAIANKVHPAEATEKNIATFKEQLGLLGFTYDWTREVNTTDPNYYKWTQWAFLQMFKRGLAFESNEPINWCPTCLTGLANEDLEDGKCERCGTVVERRPMRQWVLKITDYAERLLKDIDLLDKWPEPIKEMQRNWIGKSEGAVVKFLINSQKSNDKNYLEVFTTRPDTLFGVTYMVIAPEHEMIENFKDVIQNYSEITEYLTKAKNKSDLERTELQKEKTGVEIKGLKAINPVNNEELSIFVADYVLGGYGTGAIMAVPAHDERDWEFAKKYNLPIKKVVKPEPLLFIPNNVENVAAGAPSSISLETDCFTRDGIAINSDFLNGLKTSEAKEKIITWLEENGLGKRKIQYKLRDWVFSRQRYWGEPIPLVYCDDCKNRKYNYIIIHGFTSNSQRGFKPWLKEELEKKGHKVWSPDLPNTNNPNVNEQAEFILKNSPFVFDDNLVLVGHSLGGPVTYRILESIKNRIARAVLVDPVVRPQFNDHDRPEVVVSCDWKFDWEKIQNICNKIIVLGDVNRPIIKKEHLLELEKVLSADLWWVTPRNYHFSSNDGIIESEPTVLQATMNTGWIPLPESELPLELPNVKKYEPSGTGESPLANIEEWVNTKCPVCGGPAKRETNTMPQWAGSCWYYLRYCDPNNKKELISSEKEKYWNPVDLYVGGAEHATRHLIYARFWHKFLYDIGVVNNMEPFARLQNVGLILAEDGRKMSKRWGNVINPNDVVEEYGADAMRIYEMFMGPFDQACAWSTNGVVGCRRFLEKVWALQDRLKTEDIGYKSEDKKLETLLHQTIKKVTEDIESMRYNTAISQLMILVNEMSKEETVDSMQYAILLKLLSPFAPHLCEELWADLGNKDSIALSEWPEYDPALIIDDVITVVAQVNGKVRDEFQVPVDISEEEIKKLVLASDKVQKWLEGKEPKKVIYVKGRLVSIVV